MTQAVPDTRKNEGPGDGHGISADTDTPAEKAGKRKTFIKAAAAAALIVGAAIGLRYLLHALAYESTDDAHIEGHVVQISPRVMGHVLKVHVSDNQFVKEGDLLVELDPADYQARLAQAKAATEAARIAVGLTDVTSSAGVQQAAAALESARAGLQVQQARVQTARVKVEQARAQIDAAAAALDQAKAEVSASQAQEAQAQADLERYQQIARTGGVTQQDLDKARTVLTVAESKHNATRKGVIAGEAQLIAAKASDAAASEGLRQEQASETAARSAIVQAEGKFAEINVTPQRIEQSKANHEQLQAAADLARLQLDYTKIHAPRSGRVTRKSVEPGEYVQVGQPLMAIVPDQVWVVANYKETQLTHMKVGQAADIYVDTYPGHTFEGHVDSIQSGTGARFSLLPPENATGNFVKIVQRVPVKIVLNEQPDSRYYLGPGMSVVAEVRVP